MVWGIRVQNNTGLAVSLTPNGNIGSADRIIQLDGYRSITIQEVGDRVRRTGTTWAVVIFDGFHTWELGYEGGPTFTFTLSNDSNLGVTYSVPNQGNWQLPKLPPKTLADRSAVWIYTLISGLVVSTVANSAGQAPSLQPKTSRIGASIGAQLWVWSVKGQIVNTSANKCLSTDGSAVTLAPYQDGATPPAEQVWSRNGRTGRINNSKYPTKILRPDRPQLRTPTPPTGSKDDYGYGYIVGATLILADDSPMWQPTFFDGPELREWCLIPPGFAQPIFSPGGVVLDRITLSIGTFSSLTPSQLWYHSRGLLVNDLDGQSLGLSPSNTKWYPVDGTDFNVNLVGTQPYNYQYGGALWTVGGKTSNAIFNNQVASPFFFNSGFPRVGLPKVFNIGRITNQMTDYSFGNPFQWQWFRGPDLRSAAFIDITVAPNGFLVGLTSEKRIFCSTGNLRWTELPPVVNAANAKPTNVSLGSASMLYILLDNGQIYKLGNATTKIIWTAMPVLAGGAKYISCGVDNSLWAISNNGKVFSLDGTTSSPVWTDVTSTFPSQVAITGVSVATHDLVWAVDSTGKAWRRITSPVSWVDGGATDLSSLQVGIDGTVLGITQSSEVKRWTGTNRNTWEIIPGFIKSLAVASANLIIGLSHVEGIFKIRTMPSGPTRRAFRPFGASGDQRTTTESSPIAAIYGATYDEIVLCANMANAVYDDETTVRSYLTGVSYTTKIFLNQISTDTQGFVAWNSATKVILVSFRGTTTGQDWANNLNPITVSANFLLGHAPATGLAPKGFADAYISVKASVWNAVKDVVDVVGVSVISKIYVTGHSLGGAVAAYCAADLAILLKSTYGLHNPKVLKLINFAAPRSANDDFFSFFSQGLADSLTAVAVIHDYDTVPYISVSFRWWRLGRDLTLKGVYSPNLLDSHSMVRYNALLAERQRYPSGIDSIQVSITTGSSSFGFFDSAGTDRMISIGFGRNDPSALSKLANSKTWPLEKVVFDMDTGMSGRSMTIFDSDQTDSFDLLDPFVLDLYEVNSFTLFIDNELSNLQIAFATYDNWLVTGIQVKINGAIRYNKSDMNVRLGPLYKSSFSDTLSPP